MFDYEESPDFISFMKSENFQDQNWAFQRGLILDVVFADPKDPETTVFLPGIILESVLMDEYGPPVSRIAVWNSFSAGGYQVLEVLANRVYRQPSCKTIALISKILFENDYNIDDKNMLPYLFKNMIFKQKFEDLEMCDFGDKDGVKTFFQST